jgi:hypothetical protein
VCIEARCGEGKGVKERRGVGKSVLEVGEKGRLWRRNVEKEGV